MMTSWRWKLLLLLALLTTGWVVTQKWQQSATHSETERAVLPQPADTTTIYRPKTASEAVEPTFSAASTSASSLDPTQDMPEPTETYVRDRMPDNLQSIRNADILEFDRKISPHTAGGAVYMHKLLSQPRDEEWASATEEILRQVTEQFYAAINSASNTKIAALHVECRTDLCYVDLPYDTYWESDKLRRGGDRKADMHIYSLVGKEGEPFAHQLVKNGVGTNYEDKSVARWILAFDRGEATAVLYANSPPPG
ncbi:hypothetical protein HPT27_18940 [Permianibacter sp. IMCC34836]|uniref:hypothetical protein n=1 Tax=Permianibacter fluminis TaxID=2738515 RepID=UPI001555B12C|nr:hypothetical protein [Permianibacter fluminis]NQD39099.1 hypothetical protein [Permianibacter fluminis]